MIDNIRKRLDLVRVLGLRANVDELERLLRVIERKNLSKIPEDWSRRRKGRSLSPGRRGLGAGYMFYNLQNEPLWSFNDSWYPVRAPHTRLHAGKTTAWDFDELALYEKDRECYVGTGMYDKVIAWDEGVRRDLQIVWT